jgi:hypothetical protein
MARASSGVGFRLFLPTRIVAIPSYRGNRAISYRADSACPNHAISTGPPSSIRSLCSPELSCAHPARGSGGPSRHCDAAGQTRDNPPRDAHLTDRHRPESGGHPQYGALPTTGGFDTDRREVAAGENENYSDAGRIPEQTRTRRGPRPGSAGTRQHPAARSPRKPLDRTSGKVFKSRLAAGLLENLAAWLDSKRHALKPKTVYRYTEIITKELSGQRGTVAAGLGAGPLPRAHRAGRAAAGAAARSPPPGRDVDAHRRSAAGAGVQGAAACHVGDHRGSLRAPHGGGGARSGACRAHCDRTTMIRTCSAAPLNAKPLFRGGAACRNRTDDLLITSELLWPTELRRRCCPAAPPSVTIARTHPWSTQGATGRASNL